MAKRDDRSTEEGRIATFASVEKGAGAMIELLCESAPVASNGEFVALANDLAEQLATGKGAKTAEELWSQPSPSRKGMTLEEQKDELQNKIREVFRLSRLMRLDTPCGSYVHHDAKSGVLLSVEGGNAELAKDVSMHVAAMRPKVLHVEELDPAEVAKERAVLKEAALKEGKPENIVDKMVEGRLRNFYAEHVLTEQPFVKDEKNTVGQIAKQGGMKIRGFTFWRLGEAS